MAATQKRTKVVRPIRRSLDQLVKDIVYPGNVLSPDPELEGSRIQAALNVLCSLPEDDYKRLVDAIDSFQWFIPESWSLGMVYPFFANVFPRKKRGESLSLRPYARVIYLAPALENWAFDLVVAVVAHELAHVILDHPIHGLSDEVYEKNECEVFQLLCKWGFGSEARKHHRIRKGMDTRKAIQEQRLMKELTGKSP
jgi:hypothetical protein